MVVPRNTKISRQIALLRIGFGVIWAIDAVFKWQPAFLNSFAADVMSTAQGQPSWLNWWFDFWMRPIMDNPHLFAVLTAIAESLIAIALLFGIARRFTYVAGALFALLIWGVGEGFGGPYVKGSTDIGASIIYVVVFIALYELERVASSSSWSLDRYIVRKLPGWSRIANPKPVKL